MDKKLLSPYYSFDLHEGMLLKSTAEQRRATEAGSPVIQIGELITSECVELTAGSYEKGDFRDWTNETYMDFGRQALRIIQPPRPNTVGRPPRATSPLTERHMQRLYFAGLGPERRTYTADKRFGSFSEFQRNIGSPVNIPNGFFDNWSVNDFVEHARSIHAATNRRPRLQDFDAAARTSKNRRLPGYQVIQDRYGGIAHINERLGFPNLSVWERDDFIDWGLKVKLANPGKKLNIPLVDELSKRQRGPSASKIIKTFDQWSMFLFEIEEADRTAESDKVTSDRITGSRVADFVRWRTPHPAFNALSSTDKRTYVGIFSLTKGLTGNAQASENNALRFIEERDSSSLLRRIRKIAPAITQAQAEVEAMQLAIFDTLWPSSEDLSYLAA